MADDRIADELEIRNLIARLAQMADMATIDELDTYLTCFTADAVWDMAGAKRSGHAEIRAGAEERRRTGQQGPGANSRHVITTQTVSFDGPHTATSDAYFLAVGDTTTAPTIKLIGHYHDTLRREDGRWKMAYRKIVFG